MTNNLHSSLKDQREEKRNFLTEVSNKEKQLVMLIHTKGLLHSEVRGLYRKLRSGYEKIIMYENEQSEVQDLEYCLWKLHYKHIDEFRKRIKCSTSGKKFGEPRDNAGQIEGFKLFLSEATEFYQILITKIRKCFRLPDESSFYRRGDAGSFPEPEKIKQCHFLCHRFLVCLGDLARYREQYEKPDARDHSWSMAATYYMEATAIWPDSGNPQNQLAVLATYVGDEFLALYHCIRSHAVKEPFPDAQDNLIVLLERNRSSFPPSLSTDARFNFLKPSEKYVAKTDSKSSDSFSFGLTLKYKNTCSTETDVWSLFIRLISFFFIKSSVDDFPSAFASIMRELDTLMALNDTALKASLESYQQMDSVKTGPFRALQVVSIFLYTLQNLIDSPQNVKDSEDAYDTQLTVLRQWALPAAFIFMGRFIDRCLKSGVLNSCPLLPAVLVFVEWLANRFDEVEKYQTDEKTRIAMVYFFNSFIELLKGFGVNKRKASSSDGTPLWEDYELRGFVPVAFTRQALDFSSPLECIDSFRKGIEFRARRIISAGRIIYDKSGGKFMNPYVGEYNDQVIETKDTEKDDPISINLKTDASYWYCNEIRAKSVNPSVNGCSVTIEDEEVIIFSPLPRHNSAPVGHSSNESTPRPKETEDSNTSVLVARNQAQVTDPSGSPQQDGTDKVHRDTSKQHELVFQSMCPPISAGPPSLSAWVIDGDNFIIPKERSLSGCVSSDAKTHALSPIVEAASESLYSLSITEDDDSTGNADSFFITNNSSPLYAAPSAPLLPDDAAWYATPVQPDLRSSATESLGNAPTTSYPNWAAMQAPTEYTLNLLPQRPMTSSEWLRHYLQTHHNLVDRSNHQATAVPVPVPAPAWPWPAYYYANTGSVVNPGSTMQVESPPLYTTFPLDYGMELQQREKLVYGYQRPSPHVCGAAMDAMIGEPQPLLQYLKERERQLQGLDPGATLMRGPTYTGN